jgi:ankyrin repeat protein
MKFHFIISNNSFKSIFLYYEEAGAINYRVVINYPCFNNIHDQSYTSIKNYPYIKMNNHICVSLHQASIKRHVNCITTLLNNDTELTSGQQGNAINTPDEAFNGYTPLHYASQHGHIDCIMTLIDRGANINAGSLYGWRPLQRASLYGHHKAVRILLDHKENEHRTRSMFIFPRRDNGADLNVRDDWGRTPLHSASNKDCEYIPQEGSIHDVNNDHNRHPECIRTLLEYGANINATDRDGFTPLHVALNKECITTLIENGANVNGKDNCGRTPLHVALMCWCETGILTLLDSTVTLLDLGADVNAKDHKGRTPLHYVSDRESIRILLNYDANPNIQDNEGRTPLDLATEDNKKIFNEYFSSMLKEPMDD